MTAFNINSGGITSWDSLSGGSVNATLDSYAISAGSTLLIDTDSYQCDNHSAASAGDDAPIVIVAGNKGYAKPVVATGTISRAKGISISLVAEQDRAYVA